MSRSRSIVAFSVAIAAIGAMAMAQSPATRVASQVSPLDPLVMTNQAFAANDGSLYAKAHSPGTPEETAYTTAMSATLASQARLVAAYRAKIDPHDKKPLRPWLFGGKDLSALIKTVAVKRVDDRTADIVSPDLSSPRFRVVLLDGQWRIETAATLNSVESRVDPAAAIRIKTKGLTDQAEAFTAIAEQINAGELTTTDAVTDAIRSRVAKIQRIERDALFPGVAFLPINSFLKMQNEKFFKAEIDTTVHRFSPVTVCLSSSTAKPFVSGATYRVLAIGHPDVDLSQFLGKRIRISAYVKSADLSNCGTLFLIAVSNTNKQWETFDPATDRAITGTTDWRRIEIVADITPATTMLNIGIGMSGTGRLWLDDPRIEIVGNDVPTTDDHDWSMFSIYGPKYTKTTDAKVQHDGHPTVCIASHDAPAGAGCQYRMELRHPDKYVGHQVALSAWIKTENVTKGVNFSISMWAADDKQRRIDDLTQKPPIKGTTEWQLYRATANVPADTRFMEVALNFPGNGKVWIEDLKFELADPGAQGL